MLNLNIFSNIRNNLYIKMLLDRARLNLKLYLKKEYPDLYPDYVKFLSIYNYMHWSTSLSLCENAWLALLWHQCTCRSIFLKLYVPTDNIWHTILFAKNDKKSWLNFFYNDYKLLLWHSVFNVNTNLELHISCLKNTSNSHI